MRKADEESSDSSSAFDHTFRILIFSFLRRYANAPRETILSKALPMPKRRAMPMSVGVHTPNKLAIASAFLLSSYYKNAT